MKKSLACSFALLALGAVAPLSAGPVYVPIVESLDTELSISNFDGEQRAFNSAFLKAGIDGTATPAVRETVPADKAFYLDRAVAGGESGLLEIDAEPGMEVNAWIKTRQGQQTRFTGVPVINSDLAVAAGSATFLNGLRGDREIASLDLVNLGREKASCQVDLLRADGSAIGAGVAVDVPALSMRPFADALGLRSEKAAVSARVSCDQAFYAYAVGVDRENEVSFATPAAAADAARYEKAASKANVTFTQPGTYHTATKENPKKILRIPIPQESRFLRLVAEFDFTAGPWNPRQRSGSHGLMWLNRGKHRSNTVANVNALGPNKSLVKINQNLDLPPKDVTVGKAGLAFNQGQTYHARVAYDAANKSLALTISSNGSVLKTIVIPGTARGRVIDVHPNGLFADFGHYNNQHLPEVASLGWKFANFKIELFE